MYNPNSDYSKWNRKEQYKALRIRYVILFFAGLSCGLFVYPVVFHFLWATL